MTTRKKTAKATGAKQETKYPKAVVQEALQLAFVLKGHIKRAQKYYLVIGRELAKMREEKYYEVLHHPTLADFAKEHLGLSQASMYRYLQMYDWASQKHPEWLKDGWKGTIPDLGDVPELICIEKKLERKDLKPEDRKALATIQKEALAGKLDPKNLQAYRRGNRVAKSPFKSYLSALRRDRKRGAAMAKMPAEVISNLDEAIAALQNAMDLDRALAAMGNPRRPDDRRQEYVA